MSKPQQSIWNSHEEETYQDEEDAFFIQKVE